MYSTAKHNTDAQLIAAFLASRTRVPFVSSRGYRGWRYV